MNKVPNTYYIGLVILGSLARIFPHPANFTPTGAIAFFAGRKISDRRVALTVPLLILMITDLVLGWHTTLPLVYGCFLVCVLLGKYWGGSASGKVAGLAASSLLFYFVTNFGMWVWSGMYPRSLEGLAACYAMALPFFRNELAANLLYGAAFFGVSRIIERRLSLAYSPSTQHESA